MESRTAELTLLGAPEIVPRFPLTQAGLKGSPTRVQKIIIPEQIGRSGKIYRRLEDQALQDIVSLCQSKHLLEKAHHG